MTFFAKTLPVFIVRYRIGILSFVLLSTIFFTMQLKNLRINPDILSYLPKNDMEATLFNKIGENYGGNYIALIGIEAETIFNNDVLEIIADMNDSISAVEGVTSIISILNIIDIKGSEWGIEIGELINDSNYPKSKEDFKKLQDYVLSKEMYKDVLVSSEADFTMIAVKIGEGLDKIAVAADIRKKIESMDLPLSIYFGGMPFMMSDISQIIIRDMIFLIPFASVIILLVLFLSFRTLRGVVLPVLTVMISIIWTMGMMAILDIELSIVSNIIPVILLAVGTAYTIHVINKVNQTEGKNIKDTIEKALAYIIVPVVITAVTTMIGFISFIFGSYLTMIAIFGLFSALGVFFSLILSISFAPALIIVFSSSQGGNKKANSGFKPGVLEKILNGTNKLVINYPKQILAFWALLLFISLLGIFRIERRVDVMDYFKIGSSTRMAEEKLRLKLGGTMPVYALVQGDIQSPEVLKSMRNIADTMAGFADISHTQSIADLIEEMNDVMGEGSIIPDERAKIEQLWFLLDGQEILDQMVNYEMDEALITGTFSTMDSRSQKEFMQKMRQYAIEHSSSEFALQFTGFPAIYDKLDESIADSQFKSLALAIVLVFLIISILFKSVRNGIFASIPIIATLIILFGFMGWSKIPLDIATVLVGSISIGIGIDYAIHMISYFNHEYRETENYRISIKNAISVSGKAILINALSVSFGFLVLVFGNLIPLQRFGILVAVTMVASGLGALTLLPSILVLKKE